MEENTVEQIEEQGEGEQQGRTSFAYGSSSSSITKTEIIIHDEEINAVKEESN